MDGNSFSPSEQVTGVNYKEHDLVRYNIMIFKILRTRNAMS